MGAVFAAPLGTEAQQTGKIARIGFLSFGSSPTPTMDLSAGLRELGWIEGQNIIVEYRWASGREDRLAALAAELVRLKVDVIVTSSTPAARAAKEATSTIPIVVTFIADPVGSGLVASLARPGGNITGVSTIARGLVTKRLELLKAVVPGSARTARTGVLWEPDVFGERTTRDLLNETKAAGRSLGLQLRFAEARRSEDLEHAFSTMREARVGGILVFPSPMLFEARRNVVAYAAAARLPAIYGWREAVDVGGLMSYSTNFPEMYRRAAVYVDKILKGTKPGDLPIEEPTKLQLVINLNTAKALGLTIPPSLLARADQVIE